MKDSELTFLDGNTIVVNSIVDVDLYEMLQMSRKTFYNFFIKNEKDLLNIDEEDNFLNEPIVLIELIAGSNHNRYLYTYKFTYNPYLSKLGIYIDEDFVWQSLVEFLSNKRSEKEISPEVSNENKILSKGFDLKTSFRPNMKKKK